MWWGSFGRVTVLPGAFGPCLLRIRQSPPLPLHTMHMHTCTRVALPFRNQARLFVSAGVDKIRLTGGEPTLRKDLVRLVASLSALPGLASIGITTNGLTLGRQLAALRSAGLTHLNISLDTLRPDRFVTLTRRQGHARVLASIQEAIAQGYDPGMCGLSKVMGWGLEMHASSWSL